MDEKQKIFKQSFIDPVKITGKYTTLVAICCLFIPGLYLYTFHGIFPSASSLGQALIAVWSFAAIIMIIEPIVYFPILGFGGTYMGFLVGNILNLRVPVSAAAQQVVGTKQGTPESEIVSTIAIGGSIIANELVLIIGIVVFLPFINDIQEGGTSLSVAMSQVLPALFGALGGAFLFKAWKLALAPFLIGGLLAGFFGTELPLSVVIPPLVIVSVIAARILYKKGWVKGKGLM